jgi:hypothetical protein
MTLFNFFSKLTLLAAPIHMAQQKSRCRAMHGGATGVATWQSAAALAP